MSRGDEWSGTLLVQLVPFTSEPTEMGLYIDPDALGRAGGGGGKVYHDEDGTRKLLSFSSLLSYDPTGYFTMKACETLAVKVTLRIPLDLPETIPSFSFGLNPYGIEAVKGTALIPMGEPSIRVEVV